MSLFFKIHPVNPPERLIDQAVQVIKNGGVIIYPTDVAYAIGCHISDQNALDRIRKIRQLDKDHLFTLVCHNLSNIATYAIISNPAYRALRSHTPGPYTFILTATKIVPKRLLHPKRKNIGIRVPDCLIVKKLLEALDGPLISSTLSIPGEEPLLNPEIMKEKLFKKVDLIIDGGVGKIGSTSIIDLSQDSPVVIREGDGDVSAFI
ncbi:MAG: threonylcarbamoyl-AMP synthase [Oligoflexia bacterium]|nr:threonylcarbamoyl-AMP synthase [Oligoflexia bacterium]